MGYDKFGNWVADVPASGFPPNLTPQFFGAASWPDVGVRTGTLVGEAGNQGVEGMAAVADTLNNRANDNLYFGRFGELNPTSQALGTSGGGRYYQYNTWNPGDPAFASAQAANEFIQNPAFAASPDESLARLDAGRRQQVIDALWAQRGVFGTGELAGVAGGSAYYANPSTISPGQVTGHSRLGLNAPDVLEIGTHRFYGQGANSYHVADPAISEIFDTQMYAVQNPYLGFGAGGNGYDTPRERAGIGPGGGSYWPGAGGGYGDTYTLAGLDMAGVPIDWARGGPSTGFPSRSYDFSNVNTYTYGFTPDRSHDDSRGGYGDTYNLTQTATPQQLAAALTVGTPRHSEPTPAPLEFTVGGPSGTSGLPNLVTAPQSTVSTSLSPAPQYSEWADYPRYGGSQGGDTMGGQAGFNAAFQPVVNYNNARAAETNAWVNNQAASLTNGWANAYSNMSANFTPGFGIGTTAPIAFYPY